MNTEEFIAQLNERLAILTEEERRDILDEYEQHIDMKTASGISEEEVIADFGRIEDLTANILEAYHVRADYAEGGKKKKDLLGKLTFGKAKRAHNVSEASAAGEDGQEEKESGHPDGRKGWAVNAMRNVAEAFRRGWRSIIDYLKRGLHKIGGGIKACTGWFAALWKKNFKRHPRQEENGKKTRISRPDREQEREIFPAERRRTLGFGNAVGSFCRKIADACLWCIRWCWNLIWACGGLMIGTMTCVCIFCLGTCIVLGILGYPLSGVIICLAGLTLCMAAVTVFCFTLIIRKKERQKAGKKEEEIYA